MNQSFLEATKESFIFLIDLLKVGSSWSSRKGRFLEKGEVDLEKEAEML